MANDVRSAQVGDVCVLLVPGLEELAALRRTQESLAQAFDGWLTPEVVIACQRFDLPEEQKMPDILAALSRSVAGLPSFPVYSDGLVQFHAPFWQAHVLRWQVQESPEWKDFITNLDAALQSAGVEPHYPHDRPFTCSAVDLITPVQLEYAPKMTFPRLLFTARQVVFSKVLGLNDFKTLASASLFV